LPLLLLYLLPLGLVGWGVKKFYDRHYRTKETVPAVPEE
jgi:hypothetical protein